jgi:hypothetical protein
MTTPYDPGYTPTYASVPVGQADNDHMKVLSICHYVWGGLGAFFGLFPCIHITLGVLIVSGKMRGGAGGGGAGGPPDELLGWMFIIMGSLFVLFFETSSLLTLLAGRSIAKRRRYVLVMISAGMNCLFMPIGTVLGIFTFIVMLRPSVKAQFLK